MLKKLSLKALQKAINQAIGLDPSMPNKLQALHGKVIEMRIAPLEVIFYIQFKKGTLVLLDKYKGQADTLIRSSPLGLIRLSLLPASKARSLFNETIEISGDVELGQEVKRLFDDMAIDWEGHLAHFTGDVVAYQIGSFIRKGWGFKKQFDTSLEENITEFLQEECRLLPSGKELQDFCNEVDRLAMDVERLEAQVNNVLSNHENH